MNELTANASVPNARAPRVESILKFFDYTHLPPHLKEVSKQFADLASYIDANVPPSAERTVALRKLLEGKDAAVRACLP